MASTTPKRRKRGESIAERLERAVSTVANAASVAATGSELGVLELAVEDDLGVRKPKKRANKKKASKRKKPTAKRKAAARKQSRTVARKAVKRKKPAKARRTKRMARRRG